LDEESKTGLGKRIRKPVEDADMLDEDYDSEEDESFKDEASPVPSGGEEDDDDGVVEEEDEDDVSMVDDDLEDEVKDL